MKKTTLISLLTFLFVFAFAFSLTACDSKAGTLESLKSEYGIVVEGGGFEKGSTLVSNEIVTTTEEGAEVLAAIADQSYNKDGSVYIFDIYVTKEGVKVQPSGKVKVFVPMPNAKVDNYLVFHVKADNSVENLVPTVADGKISFETSSFSYFVIAEVASAEHVHNYQWVELIEPTCEQEGVEAHYHCEECGKNFNPNYVEVESISIPKANHEYGNMYYERTPNFWEDGNVAYYQCATCEKYFDEEYNEVESVVIPKYSTNLSICVNGTPTALVLSEHNDSFIEWSYKGLSVAKGDVITLCQTDNAKISHNYFAEGNVDTDGKILTTVAAANVVLTATPNGLMLFIDGYKYEGIVIEINGEQYPMSFVTYPDGETTSYVYGYVNLAVGDKFVIVDNVSGTVYDYDDLGEELLWDTWDFHRGNNGEFVIDFAARYGIEFDNNGNKKIYVTKAFAPYNGQSFGMVFEGEREDEMLAGVELPSSDSANNEFMWTLTHCTTMNNADIVEYIGKSGLWFYYTMIDLEAGEKFSLKNFTTGELIGADHLVDVTGDITAVTREGALISVQKKGSFYIIYLPAFNSFTIECDTSDPFAEINLYAGDKSFTLVPDEKGNVFCEGFESKTYHAISLTDSRFSPLPIILDETMEKGLVDLTVSGEYYLAYPTKEGIYNLRYNVYTNVLFLECVEDNGSSENPADNYLYSLSITNGASDNQTLSMQVNTNNSKEVYCKGVTINASYFISVIEIAKESGAYNTYGALAETDSSIAQSYGTIAMVKITGTYDVYFDAEAKTIKLVVASNGSCADGTCIYDEGVVTKEPTHFEEGVKTYTCAVCGRTKEELIEKTAGHSFGEWKPDATNEDKHTRGCNCGEVETGDCTFDRGVVTKEPTHYEEGVKTYTCAVCGRIKEELIEKTAGHSFGEWAPDATNENKHVRECKCGEVETADCTFDGGAVTKEPTHFEEGVKTYTCAVCGRIKEELIEKTAGHSFGEWKPDEVDETKHYKQCVCGEVQTADCTFNERGVCTVCGREKLEVPAGIIIVIAGGTATFEGKVTVTSDSKLYGENANVYIAQENDVVNVTLSEQEGRTFKCWVSATGTIIPDKNFSILVFRSGYYYPVFEDTEANEFSNRSKIVDGNCEEGDLYMLANSKGDVKYELEFVNYGRHDFAEYVNYNSQYHKQECLICGETIFKEHTEYSREIEKEAGHTEEGLVRCECFCGHIWTEAIPVTDEHTIDYDDWHIVEESKNGQYGKYRVYCKYCDYYEEYWYLGGLDFVSFMDGKMINYQYTYGGKV
ncbi:MAG: hypothetical protein IJV67_07140, partial [Clostridia bacterium]|nr:hypothetical protein [Clostridia bacterium]